jgi:hypothetical protein
LSDTAGDVVLALLPQAVRDNSIITASRNVHIFFIDFIPQKIILSKT